MPTPISPVTELLSAQSWSGVTQALAILVTLIFYDLIKFFLSNYLQNVNALRFNFLVKKNEIYLQQRIAFFCKLVSLINEIQLRTIISNLEYDNELLVLRADGLLFIEDTEQELINELHDLFVKNKIIANPNLTKEVDQIKNHLVAKAKT